MYERANEMKAARIHGFGSPDVIAIDEVPLSGALVLAAEDRYPLSVDALLTFEFWRRLSWKQLKQ